MRLLLAVGLLLTSSCWATKKQWVSVGHPDVLPNRIDGRWFLRDVFNGHKLTAIELVYCPIVDAGPPACRSAVVWRDGQTELFEGEERTGRQTW